MICDDGLECGICTGRGGSWFGCQRYSSTKELFEIIVFAVSIWQYDVIQLVDENAIMMYYKMLIIKLVILVYKQKYENRNCVHNE